jgi:hypothetical protein
MNTCGHHRFRTYQPWIIFTQATTHGSTVNVRAARSVQVKLQWDVDLDAVKPGRQFIEGDCGPIAADVGATFKLTGNKTNKACARRITPRHRSADG